MAMGSIIEAVIFPFPSVPGFGRSAMVGATKFVGVGPGITSTKLGVASGLVPLAVSKAFSNGQLSGLSFGSGRTPRS